MKPRAAWPVLAKKAKERSEQALAEVVKARERVKTLEASRARMDVLYEDYLQKCREAEQQAQSITVSQNFRGFLQQIQGLIQRVNADMAQAQQAVQQRQMKLLACEKKRLQMETLMQKDMQRVQAYQKKRDQQAMDAAGVMLYNFKSS